MKMFELIGASRGKCALWGVWLVWSVLIALLVASDRQASAGASAVVQGATMKGQGNAERGKGLFNGKGICYYCHGQDAHPDQLPQLAPDAARVVADLNPTPPDLRDPQRLKLTSDKQRFRIIREGHVGTGMFPDAGLSDQDIQDLLAYLSDLRRSGSGTKG